MLQVVVSAKMLHQTRFCEAMWSEFRNKKTKRKVDDDRGGDRPVEGDDDWEVIQKTAGGCSRQWSSLTVMQ